MECLHLDGEKGQEVSATLLVQTWLRRAEAASSVHPLLLVSNKLLIRQPPPQLNFEPASSSSRPQSSAPAVSDSLMVRGHAASLSLHHSPSEETIESHGVLEEVFAVHRDQSVAGAWDADSQLTTSASDQPLYRRVEVLTEWAPMRKPAPAPLPPLAAEVCDAVFDRVWGVIVPRIAGVVMEALCATQSEHQLSQTPVYCGTPVEFGDLLAVSRKHLLSRAHRGRLSKSSPKKHVLKKNMSNYTSELVSEAATPINLPGRQSHADSRSESPQFLLASFEVSQIANSSAGFKTDRMKSAVGARSHWLHSKRPSIAVKPVPKLPPLAKPQSKKPSKTPDRRPRQRYFPVHFPDSSFSRSAVKCELLRKARADGHYRNNRSSPLRLEPMGKSPSPQRAISLHHKARKL